MSEGVGGAVLVYSKCSIAQCSYPSGTGAAGAAAAVTGQIGLACREELHGLFQETNAWILASRCEAV